MRDFAGRVVEGNRTEMEMNENKRSIFHCFFPLHSSAVYVYGSFYEVCGHDFVDIFLGFYVK